jgi:hypothetical protein
VHGLVTARLQVVVDDVRGNPSGEELSSCRQSLGVEELGETLSANSADNVTFNVSRLYA